MSSSNDFNFTVPPGQGVTIPTFALDVVQSLRGLGADFGVTQLILEYNGDLTTAATAPLWSCTAMVDDEKVVIENRHSPSEAALAMAEELLRYSECALCGHPVAILPGPHLPGPHCAWKLLGSQWTPGCLIESTTESLMAASLPAVSDDEFDAISRWAADRSVVQWTYTHSQPSHPEESTMTKHTIPRQRTSSMIPPTPVVLARRAAPQASWLKVHSMAVLAAVGVLFFTAVIIRMMFG